MSGKNQANAVNTIPDILALFAAQGHRQYDGEPVTQLQHALQTAWLAEQACDLPQAGRAELISACLLHDVGHLLQHVRHDLQHDLGHDLGHDLQHGGHTAAGSTPTVQGIDDLHQYYCLPFLRPLFGAATLEPIRLHVDAKRWLCATEPGYAGRLSADSVRSLALQGGVLDAAQAALFMAQPHAAQAVRLRRWDDEAKRADFATPPLAYFVPWLALAAERKSG